MLQNQLEQLTQDAIHAIERSEDSQTLENLRVAYLGKKGQLTEQLKSLAQVSPEDRPRIGQLVNQTKETILAALTIRKEQLESDALAREISAKKVDVTLPGRRQSYGSLHPITQVFQRLEKFFRYLGFDIADGPEIEEDVYNFEALNIPAHHPARAMHDTFYFPDGKLLRTHTSPVQIRYLENHRPPIRMIAPGRVYRYESDLTHTPMFHQIEGLVIDEKTSFADLKGMLQVFMNDFFETELPMRFRPSYFPFTEPSAEADIQCVKCAGRGCRICKQTGWLEVVGCGMVHPHVLKHVGLDPNKYQGYAFGLGVDRLTMLRYQIDDLRLMFEADLRFLKQF